MDQHAYLNGRSTTHSLLSLTEKLKRSILEGKIAGVVFFDFTDAFGNVNRNKLIKKLWTKFKIRGKLFLHLCDFLADRKARIKVNSLMGEWLESCSGTSAGTVLGALLFIMHVFDAPRSIKPKYADDFSSVAIEISLAEVERKLQASVINDLVSWCDTNDMIVNIGKTKVMLFGKDVDGMVIDLNIRGKKIEQKKEFKLLGVLLDSKLAFDQHAELISGNALRAMMKMSGLLKGRRGISASTAVNLFQALVRPHLEQAAPVWAGLSLANISQIEKVQGQCLKKVLGVHRSSSTNAVEVIAGIMPLRQRLRELCMREFTKIMSREETDYLRCSLENANNIGNAFTPLSYLRSVSRKLLTNMSDLSLSLEVARKASPEDLITQICPERSISSEM